MTKNNRQPRVFAGSASFENSTTLDGPVGPPKIVTEQLIVSPFANSFTSSQFTLRDAPFNLFLRIGPLQFTGMQYVMPLLDLRPSDIVHSVSITGSVVSGGVDPLTAQLEIRSTRRTPASENNVSLGLVDLGAGIDFNTILSGDDMKVAGLNHTVVDDEVLFVMMIIDSKTDGSFGITNFIVEVERSDSLRDQA